MGTNIRKSLVLLTAGFLTLLVGCYPGQKPMGPALTAGLQVSVKVPSELRALSLGNVTTNEILYRVIGPGGSRRLSGSTGPFTTAGVDGAVTLNLMVPVGEGQVLALQLNDASNNEPLAVGAASFDLDADGQMPPLTVDLGSVRQNGPYDASNNTFISGCAYIGYGYSMYFNYGVTYIYDFTVDPVAGNDFEINCVFNTNTSTDQNIAYLGQGELVDFAYVPDDSHFFANSGDAKAAAGNSTRAIQVGDVYCFKSFAVTGGFIWIKYYGSGVYSVDDPKFIYRINGSGTPYPVYDNTYDNRGYGYGHQNNC